MPRFHRNAMEAWIQAKTGYGMPRLYQDQNEELVAATLLSWQPEAGSW